jgi:hypothetical protein
MTTTSKIFTDNIGGTDAANSTGGFGTGSIKNNATGQLIVTSFGTTTADLCTDFRI